MNTISCRRDIYGIQSEAVFIAQSRKKAVLLEISRSNGLAARSAGRDCMKCEAGAKKKNERK